MKRSRLRKSVLLLAIPAAVFAYLLFADRGEPTAPNDADRETASKEAAAGDRARMFVPNRNRCTIKGTIAPVAAARVQIHADLLEKSVEPELSLDRRHFEAEVESLGRMLIVAVDAGGRSAEASGVCNEDGRLEVHLLFDRSAQAAARAKGRCTYLATGAPVPGAVVRARHNAMASKHLGLEEKLAWTALTGEDGMFSADVPAGDYVVRCTKDMDESEDRVFTLSEGGDSELELTVEARAGIAGRVVDETGEGVAGAYVTARGALPVQATVLRETISGEGGRFRFLGLPVGPVKVDASAGERFAEIDAAVKSEIPYREVVLELGTGGMTIQGNVTGDDGAPLVGAQVGLEVLHERSARALLERHARTDAEGHYVLGGLVPGRFAVYGSQPGYLSRRIELQGEISAPLVYDLVLFKACPKVVRVLPADPKTGIELEVEPQDGTSPSRIFSGTSGEPIAVRDMAGLVNLYARTYGTTARTATRALDLCSAGPEIELDLARDDKGTLVVTVEDREGKRVLGAEVNVARSSLTATSDEHGVARFAGLPPKRYWVSSGDSWSDGIDVEAGEEATVTLEVDRVEGEVSGVVVAMSRPVEGAAIRASCRDFAWGTSLANAAIVARSDASGHFAFQPKSGRLCLVRAEHETDGTSDPATLKAGGLPSTLELHASGSIAGRVVDSRSGAPLAEYTLSVRSEGRGADAVARTVFVHDSSGRFEVEAVSPGMLSLYATASGGGKGHLEIELAAGEAKRDVEIRVVDKGTISGRLIGGTVPVSGARVYVRLVRGGGRSETSDATTTDGDGRFVLSAQGGDALRVYASAAGFYPWGSRPFDLDASARPTDLGDIALVPRGGAEEKEGGIGIQFAVDPMGVRVLRLLRESPAREAGIDVGDVITVIDGVPAGRLPLVNWLVALRGPVGTPVVLAVERGTQAAFSVTVIRRSLGLDDVPTEPLE